MEALDRPRDGPQRHPQDHERSAAVVQGGVARGPQRPVRRRRGRAARRGRLLLPAAGLHDRHARADGVPEALHGGGGRRLRSRQGQHLRALPDSRGDARRAADQGRAAPPHEHHGGDIGQGHRHVRVHRAPVPRRLVPQARRQLRGQRHRLRGALGGRAHGARDEGRARGARARRPDGRRARERGRALRLRGPRGSAGGLAAGLADGRRRRGGRPRPLLVQGVPRRHRGRRQALDREGRRRIAHL
mmetsp:Transcript_107462/g.334997  ORF Transcript_107462/g.334997 Transcript_107462/m.334997 type:complete len:245 (-) Transcript_107462:51-785(-)